jgi:hypothetical protein
MFEARGLVPLRLYLLVKEAPHSARVHTNLAGRVRRPSAASRTLSVPMRALLDLNKSGTQNSGRGAVGIGWDSSCIAYALEELLREKGC